MSSLEALCPPIEPEEEGKRLGRLFGFLRPETHVLCWSVVLVEVHRAGSRQLAVASIPSLPSDVERALRAPFAERSIRHLGWAHRSVSGGYRDAPSGEIVAARGFGVAFSLQTARSWLAEIREPHASWLAAWPVVRLRRGARTEIRWRKEDGTLCRFVSDGKPPVDDDEDESGIEFELFGEVDLFDFLDGFDD